MNRLFLLAAAGLTATVCSIRAADPPASTPPANEPRAIPLTRPEMKQFLEDMKQRKPRIPLPELTDEEKTKLGERGTGYESRLRFHYMPEGSGGFSGSGGNRTPGGGMGERDTAMSLDTNFKVELFWIVCRANNCQYCQGHQEGKLLRGGRTEDQIAALDGDWSSFPARERTAFAFTRKITYEPHLFNDADIKGLQEHFTDVQIIEMLLSIAGNNSINRWKEGAGVPQSQGGGGGGRASATEPKKDEPKKEDPAKHTYVTPTAEKNQKTITKVAPVKLDEKGQPTRQTVSTRPPLESREQVEKALAAARTRAPRLKLADAEKVKAALPEDFKGDAPQWAQLQAHFSSAKGRIASHLGADKKGDLTPLLKAQVSWIIARQDRAWYATEEARLRLKAAGQTDDQIYALDGDWKSFSDADRAMFNLAKKLAASPVVLTDDDVALTVKLSGPKLTTQMISYVTTRASFDRITEAAGLTAGK